MLIITNNDNVNYKINQKSPLCERAKFSISETYFKLIHNTI